MHPTEEAELLLEIALLQRHHKADESYGVKDETDHSVVRGKHREVSVDEDNMLCDEM